MRAYPKVTILSTFARDELVNERGGFIGKQEGGPALYIKRALEREKTPFFIMTGSKMKVRILIKRGGEFGKILKKSEPKSIKFSQIETPFLLISSVLDEFSLGDLADFKGKTFLDIQGYVRDGGDFGKKKLWKPRQEIFKSIFCLKGTQEELRKIPAEYRQAQKRKILLVTKGKRGCEVFAFGKRYSIRPSKVITGKSTIGAGDTFFAYFVSCFMKTKNVLSSAKYAVKKTSEFLSVQNIHHHNQLFRKEIGCG